MATKICNKCKKEKPLEEFYKNSENKTDGHKGTCKACCLLESGGRDKLKEKARAKRYYEKNKEKILAKYKQNCTLDRKRIRSEYYFNKKYNISLEDRDRMVIEQGGRCFCCGDVLGIDPKNINVDHDHKTGKVRKILCQFCNISFGILKEDPYKIQKLLDYAKYCKQSEVKDAQ